MRPIHRSGPSRASSRALSPARTKKITSPAIAASSSVRSTAPRMSAGIASTGRASTTANVSRLAAVRPETTGRDGKPAATSILY